MFALSEVALGARDPAENRLDKISALMVLNILVRDTNSNQVST